MNLNRLVILPIVMLVFGCGSGGGGSAPSTPPDNRTILTLRNSGPWKIIDFEKLPGGRGTLYTPPPTTFTFGEKGLDFLDGVPVTKEDFIREFYNGEGLISIFEVTFNPENRNFPPNFPWKAMSADWVHLKIGCNNDTIQQQGGAMSISLDLGTTATEDTVLVSWRYFNSLTAPNCIRQEWVQLEDNTTLAIYQLIK